MADFAPPPGPPPPRVPEGWKAVWNEQYREWFYVNIYTKQSQWDKPAEPQYSVNASPPGASPGAPPGYNYSSGRDTGPEKGGYPPSADQISKDEELARQMQAKEEQRNRGASDSFYSQGQQQQTSPYASQDLPPRDQKSKGLLGKLSSKLGGGSSSRPQQYPQQGYPQHGYPSQGYGQPYGGGYGGGGYGYGPPPGGYYQQQPQRRMGGGLGAGGGAALGLGAGLLGGAVIADIADDGGGDDGGGDGGGGGGDDGGGGGD